MIKLSSFLDSLFLIAACTQNKDQKQHQFGGPNNRKFMLKNLKNILVSNSQKRMTEQNQVLDSALTDWIGDSVQTNDITVVGIRL
jgi:hypothetical protein